MTVSKTEVTLFLRVRWLLNTIFHQAVAVVTVVLLWIFFVNYSLDSALSWHIILSTVAYVPLMAEGIILFAGDNLWTQELDRTKKYWVHGIFLALSIAAVTAGIAFEVYRKNQSGTDHFVSDHAITGLVSWLLALLGLFLGVLSWHAQSLKSVARPVLFKFIHNFLGIACYGIGITSLCLGFYIGAFSRLVTDDQLKAIVGVTSIITIWSLYASFVSCYSQLKTLFS